MNRVLQGTAVIAFACIVMLQTGCASIFNGSDQTLTITSNPSEANFVLIDRENVVREKGVTPKTVTLPRKGGYFKGADFTIKLSKAGYLTHEAEMEMSVSAWYWGNIIFGGVIGMVIVDPLTGGMFTYDDEDGVMHFDLTRKTSSIQFRETIPKQLSFYPVEMAALFKRASQQE